MTAEQLDVYENYILPTFHEFFNNSIGYIIEGAEGSI